MSAESNLLVLPLDSIRLDGGTQIRVRLNETVVEDYAEVIANGKHLPPLCIFHDGTDYWLADGFHRWHALKKARRSEALCQAYRGTRRDALLAAIRANHSHGLRRTNEDKRRAVEALLADPEWAQNTNRWLAEAAGVGHHLVQSVRDQLGAAPSCQQGGVEVRIGQDGRKRRVPARNRSRNQANAPSGDCSDAIEAALRSGPAFDVCRTRIGDLVRSAEKLAHGAGGDYLQRRLADLTGYLESAANLLQEVTPRARCAECGGSGCAACLMAGFVCGSPTMD